MVKHVFLQHVFTREVLVADVAQDRKWVLVHQFDVRHQPILPAELIAALFAFEAVLAVIEHVRLQLSGLNEALRTQFAFVRPFAGVHFHVPIECLFRREPSVALQNDNRCYRGSSGEDHDRILTMEHEYGFSPVWERRCFRNAPFDGNDLSHKSHGNGYGQTRL